MSIKIKWQNKNICVILIIGDNMTKRVTRRKRHKFNISRFIIAILILIGIILLIGKLLKFTKLSKIKLMFPVNKNDFFNLECSFNKFDSSIIINELYPK